MKAVPWLQNWTLPRVQAHRGLHGKGVMENSLEALILAKRAGLKMAEVDVQLTRDSVPVLFHDQTLDRLFGLPNRLAELSYREVSALGAVVSLAEVLSHPEVPTFLNLELKTERVLNESLERKVAQVILQTSQASSRIMFSSFNPISLWKISNYLPQVPRSLLVAPDLQQRYLREMWTLPFLKIHGLNFEQTMISKASDFKRWQALGYKVSVWTVNEGFRIQEYLDWGVESVISDCPLSVSS